MTLFRTTVFSLIFGFVSLLALSSTANASENVTAILDVPGMNCKFCPITIRKALSKVPGVIEAISDFETKTATVTFNPAKTTIEVLTQTTANAGYPSTARK